MKRLALQLISKMNRYADGGWLLGGVMAVISALILAQCNSAGAAVTPAALPETGGGADFTDYALRVYHDGRDPVVLPLAVVIPTQPPMPTQTPTASPSVYPTPTKYTPQPTPSTPPPAPTAATPPLEVTAIGGEPPYPRPEQVEANYVNVYIPDSRLKVRSSPMVALNDTGGRIPIDGVFYVYLRYIYADGSSWACLEDTTDWRGCDRWVAIKLMEGGNLVEYSRIATPPGTPTPTGNQ